MAERIEVTNGLVTLRVVPDSEDYWRERGFEKPKPRRKPAAKKPADDE